MRFLAVALLAVALYLTGCGSSKESEGRLTISAATSMKPVFSEWEPKSTDPAPRFSFSGSDEIATQIRHGAAPDVFVSANVDLPQQLFEEGFVEKPVRFASNRIVLAVPKKATQIKSLRDISKPGIRIAMGSPSVPIGKYSRQALARLPAAQRRAIMKNVRSSEPDVAGVLGKVSHGAVQVGFVYETDVKANAKMVRAIPLPQSMQPSIEYSAAVVKESKNAKAAVKFVEELVTGEGKRALLRHGFRDRPANS